MTHSKSFAVLILILGISTLVQAGSVSGTVSGAGKGTAVVYLESATAKPAAPPSAHVVIDQKSLQFQPHVVVVTVGTTVDFQNSDNVAHNVFWPSVGGNKSFAHNLGTWPQGEKKSFKFEHAGAVALLCNVHPDMSGYVVVTPTPMAAKTASGGDYKISDVPDGAYTLTVWREGAKAQSKKITVGTDTKTDLTLTK